MDFYGIGSAVKGVVSGYLRQARQTGRTTHLIDNLRDGDMVIFVNHSHADKVKRACKERGINVKMQVLDLKYPRLDFPAVSGRCFIDHVWVEQYFQLLLDRGIQDIDIIQARCGGAKMPESSMAESSANRWQEF